jgi:hypothetical protein
MRTIELFVGVLGKCLCVDPVDKDSEDAALKIFEFDHSLTGFLPWSVQRLLEVLGVMSEQRLVDSLLWFLRADFNKDEVAHGGHTTNKLAIIGVASDFRNIPTYTIDGVGSIAQRRRRLPSAN